MVSEGESSSLLDAYYINPKKCLTIQLGKSADNRTNFFVCVFTH